MAYVSPPLKWHKPKKYRSDVIATAKASGCVLQFWNSLIVGDELTALSIVDDDDYEYLIDAIYDTSNIEEWKNFRFNYRGLSGFIRAKSNWPVLPNGLRSLWFVCVLECCMDDVIL